MGSTTIRNRPSYGAWKVWRYAAVVRYAVVLSSFVFEVDGRGRYVRICVQASSVFQASSGPAIGMVVLEGGVNDLSFESAGS